MGPWSADECQLIEELLAERVEGWLEPGEHLVVSGGEGAGKTEVRFALEGRPEGDQLVLEARIDHAAARVDADGARDLAVDALDLLLLEYLEGKRQQRFTGAWETRELRGRPVDIRIERTFPALDARADSLLQQAASKVDDGPGGDGAV